MNKKVLEAGKEADVILAEARARAEEMRAEAERLFQEVDRVRETARAEGFRQGHDEGVTRAVEYAVKLQEWKAAFYAQAEPEMIRLVMHIAEKVIGKLVHDQAEAIRAIIRQAIEASLGDRIVVRINPEDYRRLTDETHAPWDLHDRTKRLTFKEDAAIPKGGCIVETEVGTIDAQLETQLKAIRKALEL
ncbi:MAG: hypothetical protein HY543_02010 [Deltaproteobacteria bacterium]|nr:hypothetical protein [Deltaproteobacteria bacterium]